MFFYKSAIPMPMPVRACIAIEKNNFFSYPVGVSLLNFMENITFVIFNSKFL